jgi:nucleoside-diphosphate-sugar epimerase
VPPGHYWAIGDFDKTLPRQTYDEYLDVLPEFTVSGDTTVHLTAAAATSRIQTWSRETPATWCRGASSVSLMRILIVGGAGYVGSLILPGLADAGHEVRVLDLAAPHGDVDWVQGSATDPAALDAAFSGADAVVHAAMAPLGTDGTADPAGLFSVLVTSVFTALDAASRAGVTRAVLLSSMSVFAGQPVRLPDRDLDETAPPDALDAYGLAKRLAEVVGQAAAQAHGMTVTALRIAWPTSEPAWPAWALPAFPQPAVVRRADGTPVPALAASDLTAAVLAALDRDGSFDVFHILGGNGPGHSLSTAKAHALLGWQPKRH